METNLNWKSGRLPLLAIAALLFSLAPVSKVQAQGGAPNGPSAPNRANEDGNDPPSRVARVSFLDGSVSMQPGGAGEWGAVAINRPVTIGDKLWTDQNSRLELQAGEVSIHLGSMTALSFLNLDGNATQMRLAEGHINFRVREMREGDLYEVDTPNLAFTVREAGAFRIDVNENGDTTGVTIIRGEGEVAAGGQTYTVHAGERATVTGADNAVQYNVNAAPLNPDDLDKWAQQRDLKEENSVSAKYVSRETVGYSDLDDYGTWKEEPTYGAVWYPSSVSTGWAPYSYGNWNWVGPWGWTWVDYAPWGFAPFHYGRWIYGGGGWGWCPGPIYARPWYGPAFVGFLGGGFGFGVGFGWGGGYGWFPLGWGEPFHPWYHCGPGYWHNVNVHNTYIANVNTINRANINHYNYRYARDPHAVTTAPHNTFVNGQAINRSSQHLTAASLQHATVANGINASPGHSSYLGASSIHGHVTTPNNAVQNRPVVARTAPAASAAHLPVHTMNASTLKPGHGNLPSVSSNVPGAVGANRAVNQPTMSTNRQQEIALNRPPSAGPSGFGGTTNSNVSANASHTTATPNRTWNGQGNPTYNSNASSRPNNSSPSTTRVWHAQGSSTDYGRAPQGFGQNQNRPTNSNNGIQWNQVNRPPNTGNNSNTRATVNRPPSTYNQNRTYSPPANYGGNRSSSTPHPLTSAPRSYSPPPAPRSYGGGGSHPSGGGSHPSGGGGGSHPNGGGAHPGGGGGGGGHPHR